MRLLHWDRLFFDWVARAERTPFEWGKWDCVLMAASAVECITGHHPCRQIVGAYRDAAGALDAARSYYGTRNFGDAALCVMGPESDHNELIDGSVGYIQLSGRKLFAVRCGLRWLAPGQHGAIHVDAIRAIHTWRVG